MNGLLRPTVIVVVHHVVTRLRHIARSYTLVQPKYILFIQTAMDIHDNVPSYGVKILVLFVKLLCCMHVYQHNSGK
jgi:hypothetical protein